MTPRRRDGPVLGLRILTAMRIGGSSKPLVVLLCLIVIEVSMVSLFRAVDPTNRFARNH